MHDIVQKGEREGWVERVRETVRERGVVVVVGGGGGEERQGEGGMVAI